LVFRARGYFKDLLNLLDPLMCMVYSSVHTELGRVMPQEISQSNRLLGWLAKDVVIVLIASHWCIIACWFRTMVTFYCWMAVAIIFIALSI